MKRGAMGGNRRLTVGEVAQAAIEEARAKRKKELRGKEKHNDSSNGDSAKNGIPRVSSAPSDLN